MLWIQSTGTNCTIQTIFSIDCDNYEIKLYGPSLEIEWILVIHNNCIFPYYGYSIEIVWIYYGFSGAIANFLVWISLFFPMIEKEGIRTVIMIWSLNMKNMSRTLKMTRNSKQKKNGLEESQNAHLQLECTTNYYIMNKNKQQALGGSATSFPGSSVINL